MVDFVRLTPQAVVSTRPLRGPYQVAIADGYTVTCAWPIAAAGVARVCLVLPTAARSVKRPLRPGRQRAANRPVGSAVAWATVVQEPSALSSWITTVRPARRAGTVPRSRIDRLTSAPGLEVSATSPVDAVAGALPGAAVPPVGAPVVAVSAAAPAGRANPPKAVSAQAQASMKCRRANLMSVFLPTG